MGHLRFNFIQYNKVLHNMSCILSSQHFELHQGSCSVRNSATAFVINKPLVYNNLVTSYFFCRCIDCWNSFTTDFEVPQMLVQECVTGARLTIVRLSDPLAATQTTLQSKGPVVTGALGAIHRLHLC